MSRFDVVAWKSSRKNISIKYPGISLKDGDIILWILFLYDVCIKEMRKKLKTWCYNEINSNNKYSNWWPNFDQTLNVGSLEQQRNNMKNNSNNNKKQEH